MPTVNPRINVTLSPSLDLLVVRLAAMQRMSKAQVLRELLEAAEPALQRAVTLMEAASKAAPGVLSGLRESLSRAQDKAEAQLAEQFSYMDGTSKDLVDLAQTIRGKRPRAGGERSAPPVAAARGKSSTAPTVEKSVSTPVPVTRGSGHPKPGKKRAVS